MHEILYYIIRSQVTSLVGRRAPPARHQLSFAKLRACCERAGKARAHAACGHNKLVRNLKHSLLPPSLSQPAVSLSQVWRFRRCLLTPSKTLPRRKLKEVVATVAIPHCCCCCCCGWFSGLPQPACWADYDGSVSTLWAGKENACAETRQSRHSRNITEQKP